jgi:hypothetical protein
MSRAEADVGESDGSFVESPWFVVVAFLCVFAVVLSTSWNGYWHLVNYSRPELQSHILKLIVIAPIFAVGSFLCLVAPSICFTVRCFTDIWEAVVIYSFLMLIIEYMGGEHLCLTAIAQREEGIAHAWPLNYCLKNIKVENMIRGPKRGALQFVILKPIMAITSAVVHACGKYESEIYQWTLFFIYNVSYTTALYALFLIYTGSKNHPALVPRKPLVKFIVVKGVIFFTFWQEMAIPWLIHENQEKWENFLFCVEFFIFALMLNHVAFVWSEFRENLKDNREVEPQATESGESKPADTNGAGHAGQGPQGWKANARNAFSPKDVVNDASRSFSSRYTRHVLLESSQEYVIEESPREKPEDEKEQSSVPDTTGKRRFLGKTFIFGSKMGPEANASKEAAAIEAPKKGSPHGTVLGNSHLTSSGPDSLEPGTGTGTVSLQATPAGMVSLEPNSSGTYSVDSRPAQDQV